MITENHVVRNNNGSAEWRGVTLPGDVRLPGSHRDVCIIGEHEAATRVTVQRRTLVRDRGLPSQMTKRLKWLGEVYMRRFIYYWGGRYDKRQSPENTMETGVKADGRGMTNAD